MMRRMGSLSALVLIASISLWAADNPKGSGSASGSDPRPDSDWVTTGSAIGQLTEVNLETKTLTLKVTTKVQVPNQQAQADRQKLLAQLQDAQRIPNPQQRNQRVNELNSQLTQNAQNLVKIEDKSQDFPLQPHDDMVVRTLNLPPFFDDKGNPRKPTEDELKELQQPPGLPGYKAAIGDLRAQQTVQVFTGYKKGESPKKPEGSAGSGSSAGSGKDPKDQPKQTAILIVIGKSDK